MPSRILTGITPGLAVTVDWRPTPNATAAVARTIRAIELHTAECGEIAVAAENLAEWDRGPKRPRASWHFAVDCDSVTQSVDVQNISWHSNAVNGQTIGIEHAGRASQNQAAWNDPYSRTMLELSAHLVAVLCERHQIPVVRPSLADIATDWRASAILPKGIVGHWDITRACKIGDHTDPGPNFPWTWYLNRVRELAPGAPR